MTGMSLRDKWQRFIMLYNKFFDLLRYSIGTSDIVSHLTEEEWEEMYETAKKQSLVGIAFQAVNRLSADQQPPRKLKLRWIMQVEKIAKRNEDVNKVAVAVTAQLMKAGIPNCVLKGQGNAMMYPKPDTRTSGDIDVWLAAPEDKIVRMAKRANPKAKAEYHHIDFPRVSGIPVELHYRPSFMNNLINNHRMQVWFKQQAKEQCNHKVELSDGVGNICAPSVAFNRIYQMAHISNHLIHEGIGLRQLLDYYYLLQQGFTEEERKEDEQLLKRFGLYKVATAVMYVLREVFGLKQEQMIVPVDERRGRFLLEEIMQAGNFGHFDERVSHDGGQLQKNTNRLKRDIRLLRYFPSECLWEPVFRWYHFFWRLRHR